ncbi:hypothetical protein EW146_g599 [Bondarzewia mesenterica]|uniref:RNA helicase n=1 Tax=Bondarzewia mesenterica TaxID=1095465 RepID=A0A4S4M8N2_9AGAM|nr:hypothetical protein EW146_g599 [Bondarzewia mesenterica]
MAKKKKTQLKPVARGFATTSLPKKVVPGPEELEEANRLDSQSNDVSQPESATQDLGMQTQGLPTSDDFDPEKVEEQSLQNLVDKLQEKTEKDIVRTVKGVETDRRYSQTLPPLDLDRDIVDRILQLVSESKGSEERKLVDEPEDKAITHLGITYGVLRRLGFSEERVEECLRSINGVDLDEAYDWLYLNCPEDELQQEKASNDADTRMPKTPQTPNMTHTSRMPAVASPSPSLPHSVSRLDVNAPVFIPLLKHQASPHGSDSEDEPASLKARILASLNNDSTSPSDGGTPDDDPNHEYVKLKLKIDSLTTWRRLPGESADDSFVKTLQSRLMAVKEHYFFDERDAEAQYRTEREKADALNLQNRLRANETRENPQEATLSISPAKRRPPKLRSVKDTVTTTKTDIFDGDDEEQSGGLFEILDELPASEVTDQGTSINIRNMALPKHWSGRTPKILLAETVAKSDRFAVVSYRVVSGASRAKRAAVSIRWGAGKEGDWTMIDVACHDDIQAEQYIATVALHALVFPSSEGFASGASSSGSQTSFRLLPPVFRELWDELEIKRKLSDDAANRAVWSRLRNIIEPKMDYGVKSADRNGKVVADVKNNSTYRGPSNAKDVASEQLASTFRIRQGSPAYQEMLLQRNRLPIAKFRDEIISTLESSQIMVLSGETGCGKSTQVPSFILEDQLSRGKYCKIYCTEPRRISAISLAQRVSHELGEPPGAVGTMGSLVGYSIRLESNTSRNTRLAFVTNGIALRMLEGGSGQGGMGTAFDEITVHERSIESDFLLIVLKSLLQQRNDLKIILMSATVDAEKISVYFGGCPILYIPGRTFPVDVRFLEDAVEFTKWSITENSPYAKRLHEKFYRGKKQTDWTEDTAANEDDDDETSTENVKLEKRYSASTATTINLLDERVVFYDLMMRLMERICFEDDAYFSYSAAILVFMPGIGEIRRLHDLLSEHPLFGSGQDFVVYPLHSTISSENQGAVFDIPPPGVRKIVIATNIAETGITIPDITCVIDSGKHREMRFDEKRQISRLVETFIAKSNAAQRRGRAGRVQNGLCFHLFTKIRHDTQLADHPLPEMMRLSLSDLALRIKIMKVKLGSSIEDVLLRALDPPSSVNIQRAISMLVEVRALTSNEEITPMGRLLSALPTDVHLGKFLLMATLFRCLDPALTIAATLNSKSPFLTPFGHEDEADRAKSSFRVENSDFLTLHNAFSGWRRVSANTGFVRKFCRKNFLSHQNLQQIEELRQQFLGYLIDSGFIHADRAFVKELSRSRYGRQRTRFISVPADLDRNSTNIALVNAALTAGLYPKILVIDPSLQIRTITNNQAVSFHPSSVNFKKRLTDFGVKHLAYFTLMHSKKLYAWETGPVDDITMLLLCGECDFKLISDAASIDRKVKFHIPPKTNLALKHLRVQLNALLASQLRGKPLTESQVLWMEVAMAVMGKYKLEAHIFAMNLDDDPIVSVLPIHLSNNLAPNVQLHQFPLLNRPLQVPPSAALSGKRIRARLKPNVKRLEIHIPVDTRPDVWNSEKSEVLGAGRLEDDKEKNQDVGRAKLKEGELPRLSEIRLRSEQISHMGAYMLGIVREGTLPTSIMDSSNHLFIMDEGQLHLHPISETHQLRPTLTYLDVLSRKSKRRGGAGSDSDSDEGPPPDPDEPAPLPVRKKEKKSTGDAKDVQIAARKSEDKGGQNFQGGLSSIRREMLIAIRAEEDEDWQDFQYHDAEVADSEEAYEALFSRNAEELECQSNVTSFLKGIPDSDASSTHRASGFRFQSLTMDSDTESESDCSVAAWDAAEFTQATTQTGPYDALPNQEISTEGSKEALAFLMSTSVDIDTSLHERIQRASSSILCFLNGIIFSGSTQEHILLDQVGLFLELVRNDFLAKLFEYRQVFHNIATRSLAPGATVSVVVCWVDVILIKLAESSLVLAGGAKSDSSNGGVFLSLHKQREEDALRAAAQLPHKWESVPNVLASEHASRAVVRLALRLTFAAYVMHPQLTGQSLAGNDRAHALQLKKSLHAYIIKSSPSDTGFLEAGVLGHTLSFDVQQRCACAMVVTLYLTMDATVEGARAAEPSSSYRPHTQTLLLNLIRAVMHPDETTDSLQPIIPEVSLDPAQTILLQWGKVVPCCWKFWNDPRCAHVESISYLTATWLCNLGNAHEKPIDHLSWDIQLSEALAGDPQAAEVTILQLLHHGVMMLLSLKSEAPAEALDVLYKCCWAASQILNPLHSFHVAAAPGLVKSLCTLWILLGHKPIELLSTPPSLCIVGMSTNIAEAKDIITESLTFVKKTTLKNAMQGMLDDVGLQFAVKIESSLLALRRIVNSAKDSGSLIVRDTYTINLTLAFLAILWHNDTSLPLHHNTLSPFLSGLVDYLSEHTRSSPVLFCTLLTALSTLEAFRAKSTTDNFVKIWENEAIWQLTMSYGSSNIVAASNLSSYILATNSLVPDALTCAEAWDFLRDALLLTLTSRFLADDTPLALIVSPTLCYALVRLLHGANLGLENWILASPWTATLCAEMRTLLEDPNARPSTQKAILQERLRPCGQELLDMVCDPKKIGQRWPEYLARPSKVLIASALSQASRAKYVPYNHGP